MIQRRQDYLIGAAQLFNAAMQCIDARVALGQEDFQS
jgi:hypothetical protein